MTTSTMTSKTAEAALAAQIRSRLEAKSAATLSAWRLICRQYAEAMQMDSEGTPAEKAMANAKLAELWPVRHAAAEADRNALRDLDTFCHNWDRLRDASDEVSADERAALLQRCDEAVPA